MTRVLGILLLAGSLVAAPAHAQEPPSTWQRPVGLFGQATLTSDLYHVSGIEARRPGAAWRLAFAPQMELFGQFRMGLDFLVSSEGTEFRQNINQFGFSPSWQWITVHLGDFSRNHSEYTVQGIRVRGAGLDLQPGHFRFGVQGGRVQRSVASGTGDNVHQRNLMAFQLGWGDPSRSHLDLNLVKVRDDVGLLETDLVVFDTLFVDTIPDLLRPEFVEQPQENLTAGLSGQLDLLARRIRIRGEVAGALLTRDLSSSEVAPGSVDHSAAQLAGKVMPLRASTSGDLALKLDSSLRLNRMGLTGGFEHIGPGFTSLGLAYVYNDRRQYHLGADTRVWDNRLLLQGRFQHQNNNLLGQRTYTTRRLVGTATASVRVTNALTLGVTGMRNVMDNDAQVDTFRVDHRSDALMTNVSLQYGTFGLPSVLTVAYSLQETVDENVVMPVPQVTAHNVSASVQVGVTPTISLAPTASVVVTRMDGGSGQHNIYAGFRGAGRFLDNRLRTSLGITRTFSHGREIFGVTAQASAPMAFGTTVSLRSRHQNHSAFGSRPAFRESFLTLSLSRSF